MGGSQISVWQRQQLRTPPGRPVMTGGRCRTRTFAAADHKEEAAAHTAFVDDLGDGAVWKTGLVGFCLFPRSAGQFTAVKREIDGFQVQRREATVASYIADDPRRNGKVMRGHSISR